MYNELTDPAFLGRTTILDTNKDSSRLASVGVCGGTETTAIGTDKGALMVS